MLKEWKWWWRSGKVRKSFNLRFVGRLNRWENPLRLLFRWARQGFPLCRFGRPFGAELRHAAGQHNCYCRTGCLTEFQVSILGFSLWGWLSRDWTLKPCHCDKVIWSVFPEHYEEDIEEYGIDKLKAEFPDLWGEMPA